MSNFQFPFFTESFLEDLKSVLDNAIKQVDTYKAIPQTIASSLMKELRNLKIITTLDDCSPETQHNYIQLVAQVNEVLLDHKRIAPNFLAALCELKNRIEAYVKVCHPTLQKFVARLSFHSKPSASLLPPPITVASVMGTSMPGYSGVSEVTALLSATFAVQSGGVSCSAPPSAPGRSAFSSVTIPEAKVPDTFINPCVLKQLANEFEMALESVSEYKRSHIQSDLSELNSVLNELKTMEIAIPGIIKLLRNIKDKINAIEKTPARLAAEKPFLATLKYVHEIVLNYACMANVEFKAFHAQYVEAAHKGWMLLHRIRAQSAGFAIGGVVLEIGMGMLVGLLAESDSCCGALSARTYVNGPDVAKLSLSSAAPWVVDVVDQCQVSQENNDDNACYHPKNPYSIGFFNQAHNARLMAKDIQIRNESTFKASYLLHR